METPLVSTNFPASVPASEDAWLRTVLEHAPDAVVGVDTEDSIVEWNRQAEATFGWTRGEVLGQRLSDLVLPPPFRVRHREGLRRFQALEGAAGPSRRLRTTALDRSGREFPVEISLVPVTKENGPVFFSYIRDLTELHEARDTGERAARREAEQALAASETLFRTLFEQSTFSTQLLSPDGRTLQVNRAWRDLWNVPVETVESYVLRDYNILEDPQLERKGVTPYLRRAFEGEPTEIPVIRYDPTELRGNTAGRPRWVKAFAYPVKNALGRVERVVLTHEDVTEGVEAAEDQKLLSDLYVRLTDLSDVADIVSLSTASLGRRLGASRCFLSEVGDDGAAASVVHDYADGLPPISGACPLMSRGPETAARWRAGGLVVVGDVRTDARERSHAPSHEARGIRAFVSVPLHRKGRLVGALNVSSASPREWDERELELARSVAESLWSAVEKARLYRQAQDAIRARDEFISICSHELKTPVTSLKLQFEMAARQLRKGDVEVFSREKTESRLDMANRQLDRMTKLIEDMLDVSRVSTDRLSLETETIDVVALSEEVLARFEDQLRALGIASSLTKPGVPVKVNGDRFRLEQVVTNLITNAIRYGEGNPIQVRVSPGDGVAMIEVEDNGIGIEPANLERIFERYERAIPASAISGLGLGLYISRRIVEAHGGTIRVRSEPGRGSTFAVDLPLAVT